MPAGRKNADPAKMRAAEQACEKYRDADQAAGDVRRASRRSSRRRRWPTRSCMREHGIDFPDPQFDENGGAQIEIGRAGIEPGAARSSRRRRRRAQKTCPTGRARRRPAEARSETRRLAGGVVAAAAGRGRRASPAAAASPAPAEPPRRRGATATVERRDLVDRENLAGTLGYADAGTLAAGASRASLTALRDPGSVITRGHSLYDVDDEPAAFLLYGALPAWRDFAPGMTDGEDVRQLERNLRALGLRPRRRRRRLGLGRRPTPSSSFQRDRGLDDDGTLARGEVVFRPGATRIGEAKAAVGDQVAPGRPLAEHLLDRARRDRRPRRRAASGSRARATGDRRPARPARTANGRITDVGKVATKAQPGRRRRRSTVTIALARPRRGRASTRRRSTSASPSSAASDVLAVPVKALLARQGGGYAVELAGRRHRARSSPGLYADDLVEVEGDGLREGMQGGDGAMTAGPASWSTSRKTYPGGVEALRGVSLAVARGRAGRASSGRPARASRRCCT